MSATPVINNLLEARKLLEITVGMGFADLDTQPTVHYVRGMVPIIRQQLERRAFRVGLDTGVDKSGLPGFLAGTSDILVASRPVGTGLDGLQKVRGLARSTLRKKMDRRA